jgi:hypothetical protein
MESQDRYQYSALTEPNAIRLIVLQPSVDVGSQLNCSLIHTTITECEEDVIGHYTAISYVWGDVSDIRTIVVDAKTLEITATLDFALRHIRSCDQVARLWADAICINQADVTERNQQVRQMALVYECAAHTIIYLGPSIPEVEEMLGTLRKLNAKYREHSPDSPERWSFLSDENGWDREDRASKYLLTRPWFTRIVSYKWQA